MCVRSVSNVSASVILTVPPLVVVLNTTLVLVVVNDVAVAVVVTPVWLVISEESVVEVVW